MTTGATLVNQAGLLYTKEVELTKYPCLPPPLIATNKRQIAITYRPCGPCHEGRRRLPLESQRR
jgi:hypothetical protein